MLGIRMAITSMSFHWINLAPAWQTMQAWRDTQAAFRANFEDDSAFLIDKMSTAQAAQIKGMADLTLRAAQKRIQTEVAKRLNKLV